MNVSDNIKMPQGILEHNISLSSYTSWKAGGKADILYRPADIGDLKNFLITLDADIPITWIGRGTNVLVRDGGIRGVVIILRSAMDKIEFIENTKVRAGVGASCAKLARISAERNLGGAEFLAGIPGTVGGALAMNSGAYGSETWDFVDYVETINRLGEIQKLDVSDLTINYRSVKGLVDEWFIAAVFSFTEGDGVSARTKIRELLAKRNSTQPVGNQSCGSVFRNPENDFAARIIESCQLKGAKIGGAQVSTKHANFIINTGDATAQDIEDLMVRIMRVVEDKCGVKLVPEVRILGDAA